MKIHIAAVNIKNKKIISMKVTDEHIHDGKVLPQLVEDIVKSKNITVCKVFADVVYDSNEIFRCLVDNGILPCIKVRRNAQVKKINHILRNLSDLYLRKTIYKDGRAERKLWKERGIVETVFSCIKRTFDRKYVYSAKIENMVKEI